MDYYATLGVTRTSEDVVIRAAYLALMRRYHPDNNASSAAAARVRAITAAFEVLRDPERRAAYDRARNGDLGDSRAAPRTKRLPVGPTAFAATSLILIIAVAAVWHQQSPRNTAASRATAARASQPLNAGAGPDCGAQRELEYLAAELLDRAAVVAGENSVNFRAFADMIEVDVHSPRAIGQAPRGGATLCRAEVTVVVPPRLVRQGGERRLAAHISYTLGSTAMGEQGRVLLADDELVARSLAALAAWPPALGKTATPASAEPPTADALAAGPISPVPGQPRSRFATPTTREPPQTTSLPATANRSPRLPAFRCSSDENRWEAIICNDPRLTALDQQVSLSDSQSRVNADAARRQLLADSRSRFVGRRSKCRSKSCLQEVLLARLDEVAAIMADRRSRP